MGKANDFAIMFISNEITIYLDMLGSFMKDWVLNYTNDASIVSMKRGRLCLRKANLKE